MSDSILISIKKLLGITAEYDAFDVDIIMHINTVLGILNQLGVGVDGYTIKDSHDTWDNFLNNQQMLEMVKTYVYLRVRMLFDPPQSGSTAEAFKNTIAELEFRIIVNTDKD